MKHYFDICLRDQYGNLSTRVVESRHPETPWIDAVIAETNDPTLPGYPVEVVRVLPKREEFAA
jgi:hypothetical protein